MSKFVRAFGYFSLGLGISLIIGYWLKQEELRSRRLASQPPAGRNEIDDHIVLSNKTLDAADDLSDDLTRIRGIGPKIAEALAAIGITRYRQLALAQADDLLERLQEVRGINSDKVTDWIKQAAELIS
jgi:predicted flap endonuclease-1-like 5' DNA nuclease